VCTGRLTVILIVVSILLTAAVPQLREALVDAYRMANLPGTRPLPSKVDYEAVALEHPQDLAIWLGFAQAIDSGLMDIWAAHVPNWGKGSSWTASKAYERAIAIAPDSPAPYLRYALHLLGGSGRLGRSEEWHGNRREEPERSREEISDLQRVVLLLHQARNRDPGNAACDYLLAYTYLALHEDDKALAALEAAIDKPRWNTANAQAATGMLRLMDATSVAGPLVPIEALAYYAAAEFPLFSHLRSFAQTMVGIGEKLRAEGRHDQALTYYEAVIHLGHVMRVDAYLMIEGLVGIAITGIAAVPFLSDAEEQEIRRTAATGEEVGKHIQKVRAERLAAYLKQHGRSELAQFYQADVRRTDAWKDAVMASLGRSSADLMLAFWGGAARYTRAVWAATGAFAAVWVLVGFFSLFARYWREESLELSGTYPQWSLSLAVAVAGVFTVGFWPKAQMVSDQIGAQFAFHEEAAPISAGIAIVLWLGLALVMTLRKRARLPAEQRVGKAQTYIASLRMLLPPTFAAFLLLSVVALWPAHENMQRWADQQRTMIEQGEVQYWNIGSANAPRTDSRRSNNKGTVHLGEPSSR